MTEELPTIKPERAAQFEQASRAGALQQLLALAEPFPSSMVERLNKGGRGAVDTVSHFHVGQKALTVVGPHDWEIVREIRGYIPAWIAKDGTEKMPQRVNGVVGVVARLTATVDGRRTVIEEIGTAENPKMEHDAENAKKAASDAYKRCWKRLGLGLHLWCKGMYVLPNTLRKKIAGKTDEPVEPLPEVQPGVVRDESDEDAISEPQPEVVPDDSMSPEERELALTQLIREDPESGTTKEIEHRTRMMYRLMEETGRWKAGSLHAALAAHADEMPEQDAITKPMKHYTHLGRKVNMQKFAVLTHDAVKVAVVKEVLNAADEE